MLLKSLHIATLCSTELQFVSTPTPSLAFYFVFWAHFATYLACSCSELFPFTFSNVLLKPCKIKQQGIFDYLAYVILFHRTNPLGMKGHIARRYGDLTQDLWSGSSRSLAPLKLRVR